MKEEKQTILKIFKLPGTNILRIRQYGGRDFFTSSDNVIIISIPNFANLIKFLVMNKYLSPKVLEGILSEVNTKEVE